MCGQDWQDHPGVRCSARRVGPWYTHCRLGGGSRRILVECLAKERGIFCPYPHGPPKHDVLVGAGARSKKTTGTVPAAFDGAASDL